MNRRLTFYPFHEVHWSRPRTNADKRFKKTKSGKHLAFEALRRLQQNWRRLKTAHLCGTIPLPAAAKKQKTHAARRNSRILW